MRVLLPVACTVVVSCAGRTDERRPAPAVAAVPAAVSVAEPAPEPAPETPAAAPAPDTIGRAKLWTGSVRFVGFSERELDELRVIPEQRRSVYRPRNAEYHGVDGFWWKQDRHNWFKIPGHCEVVVWPPGYQGQTPGADAADEELLTGAVRPQTWMKCQPWLTRVLVSQGRVYKAGWYPNAGKSAIGAGYPW